MRWRGATCCRSWCSRFCSERRALAIGAKAGPVVEFCGSLAEVMFRYTNYVMWLAPLGVGAALAVDGGDERAGRAVRVSGKLVADAVCGAGGVRRGGRLGAVIALFSRFRWGGSSTAVRGPALIAFSTASSEAALPLALENMEAFGVPAHIVGFVLPTGYSFNLDGATLYLSVASMFVAQAAGIPLTFGTQLLMMLTLMLSSKGVAGDSASVDRGFIGDARDVSPADGRRRVILGVDAVMDMGRTAVNVLGIAWRRRWWRGARGVDLSIAPSGAYVDACA